MKYNVKVFNYADSKKQIRIYSNVIEKNTKRMEEINEKRQNVKNLKKELGKESDNEWSAYVSKNRTIQNIYHICRANTFKWFLTFTFNEKRVNRKDYDDCMRCAAYWVKEMNRRYNLDLQYVLIPEYHKDKSWHIHALFSDLGQMEVIKARYPKNNRLIKSNGKQVYNLPTYFYGWTTGTEIEDNFAAISYMTKYITKELCTEIKSRKRFITSHNLKRPEVSEHIIDAKSKDNFINEIGGKIVHIQEKEFAEEKIIYIEIDGDIEELEKYDIYTRILKNNMGGFEYV